MRRLAALIAAAGMLLLAVGCDRPASGLVRYEKTFIDTFDTVVQLIAYDTDEATFAKKAEQIHGYLQHFDALYDIYSPHTGINNLFTVNQAAGKQPVKVSPEILDLLEFGQRAYMLSGGQVNIAAGAVLKLWHTARTNGLNAPDKAALPSEAALTEAAAHTDITKLIINRENSTVFLADPRMRLDVGAIAKGYATEQVAKMASGLWDHAAISAGGNVRVVGGKPDGAWEIGVESPFENAESVLTTVLLKNKSLVTSGDYQRYYTVNGKRYHHIIDPTTRYPATYHRSVTVLCADSGMADALSTALFLLPLEKGQEMVEKLDGVDALWVSADGKQTMTEGFKQARKTV